MECNNRWSCSCPLVRHFICVLPEGTCSGRGVAGVFGELATPNPVLPSSCLPCTTPTLQRCLPGHALPLSLALRCVLLNNNMNAAGRLQDKDSLARIILENGVNHVVHLATLLSGALEYLQATLHVQAFRTAHACLQWAQEGPWLCMFRYSKMPVLSNRGHGHELTGVPAGCSDWGAKSAACPARQHFWNPGDRDVVSAKLCSVTGLLK